MPPTDFAPSKCASPTRGRSPTSASSTFPRVRRAQSLFNRERSFRGASLAAALLATSLPGDPERVTHSLQSPEHIEVPLVDLVHESVERHLAAIRVDSRTFPLIVAVPEEPDQLLAERPVVLHQLVGVVRLVVVLERPVVGAPLLDACVVSPQNGAR